ncbi:hypothetical protein DSLASN_45880 [Desulfoluna limicola]|uniref:Solute-binding protein family 3/N-terminal domain-containing protein n=1 Tax=Desulfoluna limicola TaxID=2810562 RepID=A0ABM7PNV0_9BACT|nr:transporter substrate-binding domain-containing protein [Desulfoluna limicola]BCS98956.1 hypothetical protein DSLASN_45880 [Desulfoluna limicola]
MKKIILTICLSMALPFISEGAELRFTTQDFPPFSYKVEDTVSGPAADIIRRVCSEINIQCSFELLPWRRAQYWVKTGQADALFVIGWNKERAKWLHFSPPLLETEYGFFVHKDTPLYYRTPSDISGFEVGVFGPSNTASSLAELKKHMTKSNLEPIEIHMVHDDTLAFRMLDRGDRDIHYVYSNRDVGLAIIHQEGLQNIRYAGTQKRLEYYIGFSRTHTDRQLVDAFSEAFKQLDKKGIIRKILAEHRLKAPEQGQSSNKIMP